MLIPILNHNYLAGYEVNRHIDWTAQPVNKSIALADGAFSMGVSGLINAGVFSMVRGAIAGTPTFSITQSGDDVSIANDTGDINFSAAGGVIGFGGADLSGIGDLTGGNLKLEDTTDDSTGVIFKNNSRFIHNFSHPTGDTAIPAGYNTFVGVNAGNFTMGSTAITATDGSYNNAMGALSLFNNTTGNYSNAMGYYSLFSNTTGSRNNAMGAYSLINNTTGSYNNAMGYRSGFNLLTGNSNLFVGSYSGYRQTTASNLLIIDSRQRASIAEELSNSILYGVMGATPSVQSLRVNGEILGSYGAKIGDGTNETAISATGNVTFAGSARLRVSSVTDAGPMTATDGTVGDVVYNTSDSKAYVCVTAGTPATWAALN